ncbi:Phosphatidylcholine:diacylglycerol cholinephosphotransferase 1 [Capsicum baccatum]|uniref:Phosphatidylcholine:diacylglycerol cholinephosphotransferase 1 n=1 Tax=Capsicum baccatum TaxID=33114 RepID=A0A2G2WQN2_CAPBA|nr:Phosphatidylcholine:diacylglycerol cholinephosphotransferase 1 [Capsicum baccatum]
MNGDTFPPRNGSSIALIKRHNNTNGKQKTKRNGNGNGTEMKKKSSLLDGKGWWLGNAYFMKWTAEDVFGVVKYHPIPCVFAASLLLFMGVEYTLRMIPASSPPFDLGFIVTVPLNRLLAARPALNTLFAGLNTVFVAMQTAYILWTFLIEGRPRATISALFMFTFRGILGYATQLPLPEVAPPALILTKLTASLSTIKPPCAALILTWRFNYKLRAGNGIYKCTEQLQDFLGSGADFPVGNVSFFLFYSGHVAASVIASLDMKRMQRWELARVFDALNVLQVVRLLSTRGHYTIDLAVGIGAGILFDSMAGNYVETRTKLCAAANANGSGMEYENGVKYQSLSSD